MTETIKVNRAALTDVHAILKGRLINHTQGYPFDDLDAERLQDAFILVSAMLKGLPHDS